ncbi:serine/threonine-protein kinase, partial [Nocardiopsis sp. MG754419]|uniref:serine/threonine-protein kinase n=1 Tax=Nocardiopsis sp. MG754419 TaxID=2259865 RepID=UPI001BA5644D
PTHLGPFRVLGRLGSGGMGVVYAALDGRDRRAAVKCVHRSHIADREFRARFAREVRLVRRVRAPGLPTFLGADTGSDLPWLATEYVPGPTLDQYVRRSGPLHGVALTAFAVGVARTLGAIHAAGVVHRDLKPGNVILSPDGPKVLDFGIARAAEESALTRTGGLVGTPGWIAPEQYRGVDATDRSDVFAWGGLVAYAATGNGPFGAAASNVLVSRVLSDPPSLGGVPTPLRGVVAGALDKDPARRPDAAGLLGAPALATRGAVASAPAAAPAQTVDPWRAHALRRRSWARRHRRSLTLGAAGIALVLVAGAGVRVVTEGWLGGVSDHTESAPTTTDGGVVDGLPADDTVPEEFRELYETGTVTVAPDPEAGDVLVRTLEPEGGGEGLDQVRFAMGEHSWSYTQNLTVTVTAEYLPDFGSLRVYSHDFARVERIDPEDESLTTFVANSDGTRAALSPEEPTAEFEVTFVTGATRQVGDDAFAVYHTPAEAVQGLRPEVGYPGGLCYHWRGSPDDDPYYVPEAVEVTPLDATLSEGSPTNSCVYGPAKDALRGG